MQDQRRFVRWQINKEAQVKLEGAETHARCQIRDISLKGLQLAFGMKLQKDTFLKLCLVLHDEYILDNIEVWVVWHRTINSVNVYGFYFTKIKDIDKEKIYRFICRYYPSHIKRQICEEIEKGGEHMEDRRIFQRFNIRFPLNFLNMKTGREGTGQTQDVSAKGIGLVTDQALQPQTPLELWLEVPDKGEPLYTRGEVVWSEMVELDKYRVGINLEKADLMGLSRILRTV